MSLVPEGALVLVVAPAGRDGPTLFATLQQNGVECEVLASVKQLAARVDDRAGAVLLTQEALGQDQAALGAALARQPAWSDVPVVMLATRTRGAPGPVPSPAASLPSRVTSTITLERPLGRESLLSAVHWALGVRRRQFELRDYWRALERANASLRESEQRFRAITDSMPQIVWSARPDGSHDYFNRRWYEFTGVPEGSTDGEGWVGLVHPDDAPESVRRWQHALHTGGPYEVEYRVRHHDGSWRWQLGRANAIRAAGAIVRWFGTCTDIEDQVQARVAMARFNEELEARVAERTAALEAEMAERARMEEALRQAQKMEAVGQLTGGIAHDFNNMLTGIIGSLDVMKRRLANGRTDDLERFMDAARTSAQRAASLTHRLLAFSRRQSLDDRPIDVNALVLSLQELVQRAVGESVLLTLQLDPALPPAKADSSQLENALVNLAINARHAMPHGGQLGIATHALALVPEDALAWPGMAPGPFVCVAVTDTGTGMTQAVRDRAFEPFFTTKQIGQGTGLGLSMVYGFARQSGGHAVIQSEPGQGAAILLLLPVADGLPAQAAAAAELKAPPGHGERVLVVEDDPSVRLLVRDVLDELGYAAHEAPDSEAALAILHAQGRIDLLISDVGLPGMNGRQLADMARQARPGLPVLFITGYAEHAAARSSFLAPGMDMITKPFALTELATKIRDMVP